MDKKILITICLVSLIVLTGCSHYDKAISKKIEELNYPTNNNINQCIRKGLVRCSIYDNGDSFCLKQINIYYNSCRYHRKKINEIRNVEYINYTCEELDSFISYDIYPKDFDYCYDLVTTDLIEGDIIIEEDICPKKWMKPESCGDGCSQTTTNNIHPDEFKEFYLNNCLIKGEEK